MQRHSESLSYLGTLLKTCGQQISPALGCIAWDGQLASRDGPSLSWKEPVIGFSYAVLSTFNPRVLSFIVAARLEASWELEFCLALFLLEFTLKSVPIPQ